MCWNALKQIDPGDVRIREWSKAASVRDCLIRCHFVVERFDQKSNCSRTVRSELILTWDGRINFVVGYLIISLWDNLIRVHIGLGRPEQRTSLSRASEWVVIASECVFPCRYIRIIACMFVFIENDTSTYIAKWYEHKNTHDILIIILKKKTLFFNKSINLIN